MANNSRRVEETGPTNSSGYTPEQVERQKRKKSSDGKQR